MSRAFWSAESGCPKISEVDDMLITVFLQSYFVPHGSAACFERTIESEAGL
jgi:hypothetical protein